MDEFVSHALGVKASLIEAVVEGTGAVPMDGDLLTELESLLRGLSPSIATLDDVQSGEDAVDRLLREVSQAMAAKEVPREQRAARDALRRLPADAILALARVLSGPSTQRYRASSSSKPGKFYVLDVDAGDVTCTCPGFEYRGACSHARELKAALTSGGPLPMGYEAVPAA